MNFIHATGSPEFLSPEAGKRRYNMTGTKTRRFSGTIGHTKLDAVFTRDTLRGCKEPDKLLKRALARHEPKVVIAQIIAEKLGRRARADWALAMAMQASKMLNDKDTAQLVSWACMVYGGLFEPSDRDRFHALRIRTIRRLLPRKGNDPKVRRIATALNYFLARVQNVLDGRDLNDEFEPACITYLLRGFQFRRDSVFPIDKMLYKGVKLLT